MALPQRPASRFFVAFYRWGQATQRTHACTARIPSTRLARPYHAAGSLRQQERTATEHDDVKDQDAGNGSAAAVPSPPAAPVIEQPPEHKGTGSDDEVNSPADDDEAQIYAAKLRDSVRNLMRQVPSSAAVITVGYYDHKLMQHVPIGVAVSSLSTVTLDPPTISFNLQHASTTLRAIRSAHGRFRVHFPAANRYGAALVENFCRGNHKDAYNERKKNLKIYIPNHHTHLNKREAPASRAPQIVNDAVRAALECTLTQELQVADHVILVARIDEMESHDRGRAIVYIDGTYLRPDGTKLASHAKPTKVAADGWTVWDYPIELGDPERRDYVERIKKIIQETPGVSLKPEAVRNLESLLPYPPGALGINLKHIIAEMVPDPDQRVEHLRTSSPLHEFWGRIPHSARTKIGERARDLVAADPKFLTLKYSDLLMHLDVSGASKDFLPSDIAAPIRAAGLLGPFESWPYTEERDYKEWTLEYLEQVEHRLIRYLSELGFEKAERTGLGDILFNTFGESRQVASHFNKARGRLYTLAFPDLFTPDKVDIAGDITPEEARVVVARILKFLRTDHPTAFRKNLNFDYREILRISRVHPTITGFNIEFFFSKIRHIYETTPLFRDLRGRLQDMAKPWLADTVTWKDLEKRVKDFVHRSTMRAMEWPNRDKLAAMGLAWEATLTVPVALNNQPLKSGHILDTLVAKELKNLWKQPSAPSDVKDAIARFLKEQHNFDVDPANPVRVRGNVNAPSSSDEMLAARMANRMVDVRGNPREVDDEGDVRLAYDGPRTASMQKLEERPYIWRESEDVETREKVGKGRTWTEYSLLSGRRPMVPGDRTEFYRVRPKR